MTWTTQLTYATGDLTDKDTRALAKALGGADVAYAAGQLRIQLEIEASTLRGAANAALRTAAAAAGLPKPHRLQVFSTDEFRDQQLNPEPLDLIGMTEIAKELGVTRQRAGQLADTDDFPDPVATIASGRIFTRRSVQEFQRRREAARDRTRSTHPNHQPARTSKKAKTDS